MAYLINGMATAAAAASASGNGAQKSMKCEERK